MRNSSRRSRSGGRASKRRRGDRGSERGNGHGSGLGDRASATTSDGREVDPLWSFSAWARQQENNRLPVSESGYQAYVEGWQAKAASEYFEAHGAEEWFLSRYDVTRVKALEEGLEKHAAAEAARLRDAKSIADLENVCPVLDAVPEPRRKAKIGKAVGDPLADKFVVFIPRVPPSVTTNSLTTAVKETLGKIKNTDSENPREEISTDLEILVGEPLLLEKQSSAAGGSSSMSSSASAAGAAASRKSGGRNLFNRDAWVVFDSKDSAEALRVEGKVIAKATPTTPGADPEEVELTVLERRLLGNRFAFKEVSSPARIKIDLAQARAVAHILDQARRVEDGLDAFLKAPAAQEALEDAFNSAGTKTSSQRSGSNDYNEDNEDNASNNKNDADEGNKSAAVSEKDRELARQRRELDLIIGYLRHVHLTCYYGHRMYVSQGEMIQLNMLPYLRHIPGDDILKTGWADIEAAKEKTGADADEDTFIAALKEILEPRKSTYLRNVDEAVTSWLERFQPEKVQAERDARAAKIERAQKLMDEAEEEFCKSQTRFEEKGKYRCLLPPFKRFASESFVHKHIRTKQAEHVNAARVKAVREIVRQEFLEADDKPLPPIPEYAKPKDRSYYQAHFGDGPDGPSGTKDNLSSNAPAPPRKFRTVIDYSDL